MILGFYIILTAGIVLAGLYISGVIRPPLLAKALASCAFVALGAWALFALGASGGTAPGAGAPGLNGTEGPGAAAANFTPARLLLFFGLVSGALGDILLELFGPADKRFFIGVGAFFLGHALYVASFFCIDASSAMIAILCSFPVAATLTILSARLLTFEGARRLLLLVYMFALSFMCTFAWVILIRTGNIPFFFIAPGALLFLASDTFLGLQLFGTDKLRRHSRLLGILCLATYYPAQLLIAASLAADLIF